MANKPDRSVSAGGRSLHRDGLFSSSAGRNITLTWHGKNDTLVQTIGTERQRDGTLAVFSGKAYLCTLFYIFLIPAL